jgi:hypothetical protein
MASGPCTRPFSSQHRYQPAGAPESPGASFPPPSPAQSSRCGRYPSTCRTRAPSDQAAYRLRFERPAGTDARCHARRLGCRLHRRRASGACRSGQGSPRAKRRRFSASGNFASPRLGVAAISVRRVFRGAISVGFSRSQNLGHRAAARTRPHRVRAVTLILRKCDLPHTEVCLMPLS